MSYINLTAIEKKYKLPPTLVDKINKFLLTLRKNDIVSSSLFARKTGLDPEFAKELLGELVNQGVLTYYIIVSCTNPLDDAEHYMIFNSLSDLNQYMRQNPCPICECGYALDIDNAKVGYKRSKR